MRPPRFLPSFPPANPSVHPFKPRAFTPSRLEAGLTNPPPPRCQFVLPRIFAFLNEARLEQLFAQCMPLSWCNSQDGMFQKDTTFPSPRARETVSGQVLRERETELRAQPVGQRLGPSKP